MEFRKSLLLAALICNGWLGATASHISGGEITLECIGADQYEVTLILYRDCFGIDMAVTETIELTSPCGTASLTVDLVNTEEISQLCPSELPNSTCNGGTLPGMEAYTYTGIVTMMPCDAWTVSWQNCCRNEAVANLGDPGSLDTYIAATLNNDLVSCASSPVFTEQPLSYVCLDQPAVYSFNASGAFGDSMSYAFIPAMGAGGIALTYLPGYTFDQPIPGIVLDPLTGVVSFTPTLVGNFVVVVQVTVYDLNGNVVGTIMRDIQFVVVPCINLTPDPADGAITNFTGSAVQTGPYAIELCEGNNFCFDFTISDPDAGDTLALTSSASTVLPGASFNFSGTNPVSGSVCWTAPAGSAGYHVFTILAVDDACPVSGAQTYAYAVHVIERTSTGPDVTICGAQAAFLEASGGSVFTWSVLSGDPIVVGVNFLCNPCADPAAQPAVTTTYIVQSDLSGACTNADTVTVYVVPDFSLQASASPGSYCIGEPVQLNATVSPGGAGYSYDWSPIAGISDPSIADPVVVFSTPGVHDLVVNVTSPDGCSRSETVTVDIVPGYAPDFTATQDDLQIPCGGSTQFHVTLDGTGAAPCLPAPGGCTSGTTDTTDLGTGLSFGTTMSFPAVYGNWYTSGSNQILFRADELTTIGFTGGIITAIGFNIASISGSATTVYDDFEIRIGCTLINELDTNWLTGLTTVLPADTVDISVGWNVYSLSPPFTWDGISNLVVQTCFDKYDGSADYTLNAPNYFTPTPFSSVHYLASDFGAVCNATAGGNLSDERPDIRLEYCASFDPADLTYQWTPTPGLSDPNGTDPVVTPPNSPSTYTITVTDTNTGCDADTSLTVTFTSGESCAFIADNTSGLAPLTVDFTNTSTPGLSDFHWAVNGTEFATTQDASYLFSADGFYEVTLTATDGGSCTYVATIAIIVGTTGITEVNGGGLSIHPNPAQDLLSVEAGSGQRITAFWIHDLSGRKVIGSEHIAANAPLIVNVSNLVTGSYLLTVWTEDGQRTARMMVAR